MRSVQRGISAFFLVIAILAITVALTAGYFVFSQKLNEKLKSINSFDSCARHYPVMESYPEQCNTPDGKHFTRQLTEEEKQKLKSSNTSQQSPNTPVSQLKEGWSLYKSIPLGIEIQYPPFYYVERDRRNDVTFRIEWRPKGQVLDPTFKIEKYDRDTKNLEDKDYGFSKEKVTIAGKEVTVYSRGSDQTYYFEDPNIRISIGGSGTYDKEAFLRVLETIKFVNE